MSNSNQLFSCVEHDKRWHLVSQTGQDLCAKCCHHIWRSSLESDSTRKELLSQLNSSLRNGPKLANTLSDTEIMSSGETYLFIGCITRLVYHSDPQIRDLSKTSLNLLTTQMKDKSIYDFIFEDIVKKMSVDTLYWNESTLELMAFLIPELCLATHPLRDDLDILFKTFQFEFNKLNDSLKAILLKIFNELYVNSESNELFALDNDFHLKTLTVIFTTFDGLNDNSNDIPTVVNCIHLLKRLTKIESILKPMTADQNLIDYLQSLLNDKSVEIRRSVLDWIADLLDEDINTNEYIRKSLASTLEKEMMDSFIELLESKPILIHLMSCLLLILKNIRKVTNENKLKSLSKCIIKSLQHSVSVNDETLFRISLSVLKQIIEKQMERKSETQFINEFDFFLILDLLEISISNPILFEQIVDFCIKFFDLHIIPVLIPTQRMQKVFTKVMANICNTDDSNDSSQTIDRTFRAVLLIKSYLNLINQKKDKDFCNIQNSKEKRLVNIEKPWNSDDFDLSDLRETEDSIDVSKRTEIYEFLSFCLATVEKFFSDAIQELLFNRCLEQNLNVFQEICLCFTIILENDLFANEDINRFVTRMYSKGYVLSLLQLLWFYESHSSSDSFATALSSLLSHFLCKIQYSEPMNERSFDATIIQKALIVSKEKYSKLSDNSSDSLSEDTDKEFVDIFFAINYYCHKLLSNENYEMNLKYSQQFLTVLNNYLQNSLRDDFDSVITTKYSLFLSSVSDLEYKSLDALHQFFDRRNESFYSKYYTNHMKLLEWLFSTLRCDKLCEYGLKTFLNDIPESDLNLDEKRKIYSFFKIINCEEKALHVLIDTLCDTNENNCSIAVITSILEDCEQFVDESHICNNWQLFCDKLCEQIPLIITKMVARIEYMIMNDIIWDTIDSPIDHSNNIRVVNPDSVNKVIQLLTFLCRLLTNEMNVYQFETFGDEFNSLTEKLCHLIDHYLDDSSVQTIFKFFRLCLNSNRNSGTVNKSMTEYLLKSKLSVNLLFKCIENDMSVDDKTETPLFLLSVLSKNKIIYGLEHQFMYELDINRLIDLLNSESKVVTESAFTLLCDSFKTQIYFKSNLKDYEIKCEEMRRLLHSLQNAVFRRYISLSQISVFLNTFFNDLNREETRQLLQDLAKSRWFQVIVDNYLEEEEPLPEGIREVEEEVVEDVFSDDEEEKREKVTNFLDQRRQTEKLIILKRRKERIFRQEFIDFILVFLELDFVNTVLIEVINEMTKRFAKMSGKPEDSVREHSFDDPIQEQTSKVLRIISDGLYVNHLTKQNKNRLELLSQNNELNSAVLIINTEHNYYKSNTK